MTASALRRVWRTAARTLAAQGDLAAADEATRNSLARHPPTHWTTGVALLGTPEPASIGKPSDLGDPSASWWASGILTGTIVVAVLVLFLAAG